MPKVLTVADYLTHAMKISGKTQKEIALEAGFAKPNILSMMKQGLTKVPFERIPALARACGVSEAAFMRLAMQEYMPNAWGAISTTLGDILTEDEKRVLEAYREARDANPGLADRVDREFFLAHA